MLYTKYQGSKPNGFRQEDFHVFPYISLCKTFDPWGIPIFGPRCIFRTNLVEVHYVMLHTKYQGSWPCDFRQEDFLCFHLENLFLEHAI